MDQLQSDDMLLFSTDFPHWQFDGDEMLPAGVSPQLRTQDPDRQSARHLSPPWEALMMLDAPLAPDTGSRNATTGSASRPKPASRSSMATCIPPCARSTTLKPFLPTRWREHLEIYGSRRKLGMSYEPYPKSAPRACRRDAWPENGGYPGSDLELIRSAVSRRLRHRVRHPGAAWRDRSQRAQLRVLSRLGVCRQRLAARALHQARAAAQVGHCRGDRARRGGGRRNRALRR